MDRCLEVRKKMKVNVGFKEKEDSMEEILKNCGTCRYEDTDFFTEPCNTCIRSANPHTLWEPKEDKKMKKKFTKADLKDRMMVITRGGSRWMVCGDSLIGPGGIISLDKYNDDLLFDPYILLRARHFDIMKVFVRLEDTTWLSGECSPGITSIIWERKEAKELTLKEIAEKFGVDEVKIIDEQSH